MGNEEQPSSGERLARIEQNQIHQQKMLEDFIFEQRKTNSLFWESRVKINNMEAKAQGAWWTIVQMGTLTAMVSAAVAGAITLLLRLKGGSAG